MAATTHRTDLCVLRGRTGGVAAEHSARALAASMVSRCMASSSNSRSLHGLLACCFSLPVGAASEHQAPALAASIASLALSASAKALHGMGCSRAVHCRTDSAAPELMTQGPGRLRFRLFPGQAGHSRSPHELRACCSSPPDGAAPQCTGRPRAACCRSYRAASERSACALLVSAASHGTGSNGNSNSPHGVLACCALPL